jgi:two-component system sensor histidine kinase KdpD
MHRASVTRFLVVAGSSLGIASVAVGILQDYLDVPNPSALYLVAVVSTAITSGTWGSVIAALGSFLLYNFLYVEPRYTFTVAQPGELVNLLLLLFVGIVVGQLAALQRTRAEVAVAREREARAMFGVSRALATRVSTPTVLGAIAEVLREETRMQRAWIAIGPDEARERVAADTDAKVPRPSIGLHHVLQRMPGDTPAKWVRIHQPAQPRARGGSDADVYRVRIEAGGDTFGSISTQRRRSLGEPTPAERRLLAAAADQVGQALRQDRLAAENQAAEIARQSDALKSALLQSVSHDLRTPLATIRAAAGTLRPGSRLSEDDQRESADAIDREVEYLNRLVTNLLDLSRIEAGALRAEKDVFELDDVVGQTVERLKSRLGSRTLTVDLEVRPVEVDPVFLDEVLTNALENALKYTPADAAIRIVATERPGDRIRLTVEDAGPGVPDEALPRLFDKFYRVPGGPSRSRSGPASDWRSSVPMKRWAARSTRAAASSVVWRSISICRRHGFPRRSRQIPDDAGSGRPRRPDRPAHRGRRRDARRRGAGAQPKGVPSRRSDGRPIRPRAVGGASTRRVLLDRGFGWMGLDCWSHPARATTPMWSCRRYEAREGRGPERGADYVTKPLASTSCTPASASPRRRRTGGDPEQGALTARSGWAPSQHEVRVAAGTSISHREFEVPRLLGPAGWWRGRLLPCRGAGHQGETARVRYVGGSRQLAAADRMGRSRRSSRNRGWVPRSRMVDHL